MAPEKRIRLGKNGQHEVKLSTAKIAHGKMQIKKTDRRSKSLKKKSVKLEPETLNLLEIMASKRKLMKAETIALILFEITIK